MVNPFRSEKFRFSTEYALVADIHGNAVAFRAVLADIRTRHRSRIGDAVIDTVDSSTNEGRDIKKMLRYVHNKHYSNPDPRVIRTPREKTLDVVKRRLNDKISDLESRINKPRMVYLGDIFGLETSYIITATASIFAIPFILKLPVSRI